MCNNDVCREQSILRYFRIQEAWRLHRRLPKSQFYGDILTKDMRHEGDSCRPTSGIMIW